MTLYPTPPSVKSLVLANWDWLLSTLGAQAIVDLRAEGMDWLDVLDHGDNQAFHLAYEHYETMREAEPYDRHEKPPITYIRRKKYA